MNSIQALPSPPFSRCTFKPIYFECFLSSCAQHNAMEISLILLKIPFLKNTNISKEDLLSIWKTQYFAWKIEKLTPCCPPGIFTTVLFSVYWKKGSEQRAHTGNWEGKYYLLDFFSALEQKNHNAILI